MTTRDPLLIVGAYGYDNVGDEAILAGLLARLGRDRTTVVSRRPRRTAELHGVAAVGIADALGALRTHPTVLIGGGGLFGSDMGRLGSLLPWYGLVAARLGRTVVVDGAGVDRETRTAVRLPLVALLRRAARITVRDSVSKDVINSWGVTAEVAPDRSADMPPATAETGARLLVAAGVDLRRPVIGLALTGVRPALTERVLAAALETVDALPSAQFCFLPMSRHPFVPRHDDVHLGRRLQGLRPAVSVVDGSPHPAEMLAAFGFLSAVVSMRFHSLVFAERMGVPVVPVSYAAKTDEWLKEHEIAPVAPSGAAWIGALTAALDSALPGDRGLRAHRPLAS
ncbi:MAG: polysaccharide pyruvyl transferase family protein [Candidatus Limnocylindria bacterium]